MTPGLWRTATEIIYGYCHDSLAMPPTDRIFNDIRDPLGTAACTLRNYSNFTDTGLKGDPGWFWITWIIRITGNIPDYVVITVKKLKGGVNIEVTPLTILQINRGKLAPHTGDAHGTGWIGKMVIKYDIRHPWVTRLVRAGRGNGLEIDLHHLIP